VQTYVRPPSWILSIVVFHAEVTSFSLSNLVATDDVWNYSQAIITTERFFSTAVLTLKLALWKVNSEIDHTRWYMSQISCKWVFCITRNHSECHERTNERTSQQTGPITIPPGESTTQCDDNGSVWCDAIDVLLYGLRIGRVSGRLQQTLHERVNQHYIRSVVCWDDSRFTHSWT